MTPRRRFLAILGGGVILAAAGLGHAVTRSPGTAHLAWQAAGKGEDPRIRALSYALLAPNPHNRQPWIVDLSQEGLVRILPDIARLLPQTDPGNRQITIGLGGFVDLMVMAAAADGQRVEVALFPEGQDEAALDARAIAIARFTPDSDVLRNPLFDQALSRRSTKEPFDITRQVPPDLLTRLLAGLPGAGGAVDDDSIGRLRALTREALRIEVETPRAFQESVDLFRIGHREVDRNPDGIDFTGPLFESLRLAGMMTREAAGNLDSMAYKAGLDAVFANTDTAMGHVWLVSATNTRRDQMAAGSAWLRLNLAATALGLATQPLSQALQEYPEMAGPYAQVHALLAPQGGTVQMLARIGYGPGVPPSPRWPLEAKLLKA